MPAGACIEVDLDQDDLGADLASVVVNDCRDRARLRAALSSATPKRRRREIGVQHLTRTWIDGQSPAPGGSSGSRRSVSRLDCERRQSMGAEPDRRCKVPLVSAPLDLTGDVVKLLQMLIDIESVSGNEAEIADQVEQALRLHPHLKVLRDGNVVLARTELGRAERVVIAGHLDTVPVASNLPSWTTLDDEGKEIIWGRGACDMKGGVAVQLSVAAALATPRRDITWLFYDNEEVEEYRNGLNRIAREHPDYLHGHFAVLCEPTNARIEGGCQGTMRLEVELSGVAAHSARSWMGHNAIHDAGACAATPRRVRAAADRGRRADLP